MNSDPYLSVVVPIYNALDSLDALDAGFRAARGEMTATLDADLQNDPADLPRLLALLDRADVVNGIREKRRDAWFRKLGSRVANGFRNWVTGESVTDAGCSLRVPLRSCFQCFF